MLVLHDMTSRHYIAHIMRSINRYSLDREIVENCHSPRRTSVQMPFNNNNCVGEGPRSSRIIFLDFILYASEIYAE